jgi:hypothetical protein
MMRPRRCRSSCVAVVAALAVWPGGLWAADDRVRPADEAAAEQADESNLVDLGAMFDTNLFEQPGGGWVIQQGVVRRLRPGQAAADESPAVDRARTVGRQRLERIDRACGLSAAQRRALVLAMESDARRFAAEVDEVRQRYGDVTVNMRDRAGQQQWHQFQQDVQRCRSRLQRLFDADSLLASGLVSVLDADQRRRLEAEAAAKRSFRWKTLVTAALLRLDDAVGLTERQHAEIERLLLEREPPLRLDAPRGPGTAQAEQMLVYFVLAEVEAKALRKVLDERQWRSLMKHANQGRAMRSWLEQQGLLEQPGP